MQRNLPIPVLEDEVHLAELRHSPGAQKAATESLGSGIRVRAQVRDSGFRIQGLGFLVYGLGLGFRVQGLGCIPSG